MSDTLWTGLVIVLILVAGFFIFHAKIEALVTAFKTELKADLAAVKASGETGLKADIADVGAVVGTIHDVLLAHHDNLVPDINVIKAAVTAPVIPPPTPPRVISTDHLDTPVATPPARATTNGVVTPAGMSDEDFLHLIVATQVASSMLATPGLHDALLNVTPAWWNAQGPYVCEELLAQATGDLAVAFKRLASTMPLRTITAEQQAAADTAVGAVSPK